MSYRLLKSSSSAKWFLASVLLVITAGSASAQGCADCFEFFRCRGGTRGGFTCDFETGPCRENGYCPIIKQEASAPSTWWGTSEFLVGEQKVHMVVGEETLRVASCNSPLARMTIVKVGNEQYIRGGDVVATRREKEKDVRGERMSASLMLRTRAMRDLE